MDSLRPGPLTEHTEGVKTLLGNPKQAIIRLSIPMIVAMSVQTLYNLVDALWVSGLGADALSAVGFFFPFFFMIMALASGLGVGGSSAISRCIGAHDRKGADRIAAHTIVLMLVISVGVCIPFFLFARSIFMTMGAGHITDAAAQYGRIMFAGTVIIFFSNIASALLRGEGDVKRAMYAMMLGAGLNIILDPIFIYVLGFGVSGAAFATVLSLFISASMLFYWICIRRDSYVSITLKGFRFMRSVMNDILKVGLPSTVQQLTMSISVLILNIVVVKVGGTDGIAIFTTGWRVVMCATLPLIGMATAVTAVTGAAYGSRDHRKLMTAYLYAVKIGFVIELIIATLTFLLAVPIARLFTMSQEAVRIQPELIRFLRTMFIFYPTISFGMLSSSMFQGVGKGVYSLIVTLIRTIILTAPLAYGFAVLLDLQLGGVWWGIVAGNSIGAVIAFIWARIFLHKTRDALVPST
jgi:putative MATE family efflux protein